MGERDQHGRFKGACILTEERPPIWRHGEDALYLGSLAVARAEAGTHLGHAILDAAAEYAGNRELRLDCWAGSKMLCAYYAEAGFTDRGTASEADFTVRRFSRAGGNARA